MNDLDYEALTPGIRKTVELLRTNRFETTDSGDGKTNVAAGMEGAMEFPNVAIVIPSAELLVAECRRLHLLLKNRGVILHPQQMDPWIPSCQGMYDPSTNTALIVLTGVDDELLEGRQTVRG
jgi:hypothetical protein